MVRPPPQINPSSGNAIVARSYLRASGLSLTKTQVDPSLMKVSLSVSSPSRTVPMSLTNVSIAPSMIVSTGLPHGQSADTKSPILATPGVPSGLEGIIY